MGPEPHPHRVREIHPHLLDPGARVWHLRHGGALSPKSVQLANTDGTVEPQVDNFLRYDTM